MHRREIGLEADLGGICLATSVVSLNTGSVPATEPKRLPWVTPKGPAAQQHEPLLLLLSRLRYLPHAQHRGRGRQAWIQTSTLPRPLSRTLCFFQAPSSGDPACPRRWEMWSDLVAALGNLCLMVFTAAPASKQFRGSGRDRLCQITALSQAGVDGASP